MLTEPFSALIGHVLALPLYLWDLTQHRGTAAYSHISDRVTVLKDTAWKWKCVLSSVGSLFLYQSIVVLILELGIVLAAVVIKRDYGV